MSLGLLFSDEFRGFYKSRAMLALWVGLPVTAIVLHSLQPNAEGIPFLFVVTLLITSLGGIIACVTLSTSITTETNNHVYDLFLIRPVKRSTLLLAKFFAVLVCVLVAAALAFLSGYLLDLWTMGTPPAMMVGETLDSIALGVAGISIACSLGVLIGVLVRSVTVSAIGGIYAGGQLSAVIALVPTLIPDWISPEVLAATMCFLVTPLVLLVAIAAFERKQI